MLRAHLARVDCTYIALDTEGDLDDPVHVSLVQLGAPFPPTSELSQAVQDIVTGSAAACPDGCVYLFDLEAPDSRAVVSALAQLLRDPTKILVIHDCRRDAYALRQLIGGPILAEVS